MELLNILYNDNFIAVYLIGAIIVVILIFIVLSSMTTTPKEKKEEKILEDPMENNFSEIKEEKIQNISKINDLVEDLYQQKMNEDSKREEEKQDLNSFLEEFEVPNNVIEEVTNNELNNSINVENENKKDLNDNDENETIIEKENNSENIENMLKRLYDLRQNENNARKNSLLNEIYELKKQVDEKLKSSNNYNFEYKNVDTKALADYYLFNEDIEFPKLK